MLTTQEYLEKLLFDSITFWKQGGC